MFHYRQLPGSECELGDYQRVIVFGGASGGDLSKCSGTASWQNNGCELVYDQYGCTGDDGTRAILDGALRFTSSMRLEGTLELSFSDPCTEIQGVVAEPL